MTDKTKELSITASLGLVVMDIIQNLLIRNRDGLPLGFVDAKNGFKGIRYILSTKFIGAVRGLATRKQKFLIPLFLFAASLIALLAGPSTAVLVLPSSQTWSAGSATYYMIGDEAALYPTTINGSTFSTAACVDPMAEKIETPDWSQLGCPWAGYPVLATTYKTFNGLPNSPISFNEAGSSRQVIQHLKSPRGSAETWAMASSLGIGSWIPHLRNSWLAAVSNVKANLIQASLRNYKYCRNITHSLPALIPAARTLCHSDNAINQASYLLVSIPQDQSLLKY